MPAKKAQGSEKMSSDAFKPHLCNNRVRPLLQRAWSLETREQMTLRFVVHGNLAVKFLKVAPSRCTTAPFELIRTTWSGMLMLTKF
jgi:hypothetical protein